MDYMYICSHITCDHCKLLWLKDERSDIYLKERLIIEILSIIANISTKTVYNIKIYDMNNT